MSGFDVLQWKNGQPALETLPVVVWSSSDLEEDKRKARALGATSYFVKPMNPDDLIPIVKELLRILGQAEVATP